MKKYRNRHSAIALMVQTYMDSIDPVTLISDLWFDLETGLHIYCNVENVQVIVGLSTELFVCGWPKMDFSFSAANENSNRNEIPFAVEKKTKMKTNANESLNNFLTHAISQQVTTQWLLLSLNKSIRFTSSNQLPSQRILIQSTTASVVIIQKFWYCMQEMKVSVRILCMHVSVR